MLLFRTRPLPVMPTGRACSIRVYSANPVGRLALYLCGYSDAERHRLSDATCTALQLRRLQDVTVDLKKRSFAALDLLARHGYRREELFAHKFDDRFREVMREAVARARELFHLGCRWREPSIFASPSIWNCSALAACACWRKSKVSISTFSRSARRFRKWNALVCCSRLLPAPCSAVPRK